MFGVMGLSAIMNSVFGRGGRKKPVIKFTSSADDPFVKSLTCKGDITIENVRYTPREDKPMLFVGGGLDVDVTIKE